MSCKFIRCSNLLVSDKCISSMLPPPHRVNNRFTAEITELSVNSVCQVAMNALDRDIEKAELETMPSRATAEGTGSEYLVSRQSSRLSMSSTTTTSSSYSDNGDALERHPTALSRIATQRSQHSGTVGADVRSRMSEKPLPPFGAGKPYPPPLPQREEYVVEFDGPRDPLHPQNWPRWKK